MAASKSYFPRASKYRFLPTEQKIAPDPLSLFELDESDVWNSDSESPEFHEPNSRIVSSGRKHSSAVKVSAGNGPSSLPVNVPDWSKILKDEYRVNRRAENDDDNVDYGGDEENGVRVPPHEFLAQQMARNRIASFSVHEGVGRTLKGRDLSRVRNAIWEKTGFQD